MCVILGVKHPSLLLPGPVWVLWAQHHPVLYLVTELLLCDWWIILFESAKFFTVLSSPYRKISVNMSNQAKNKLQSNQTPYLNRFSTTEMKVPASLFIFYTLICSLNNKASVYFYILHVRKCLKRTKPCFVVPSQKQGSSSIVGPLNVKGKWYISSDKIQLKNDTPTVMNPVPSTNVIPDTLWTTKTTDYFRLSRWLTL